MQIARRGVVVQLEAGNEAFRRHFQEVLRFLVRVNLVCAIYPNEHAKRLGEGKGSAQQYWLSKKSQRALIIGAEFAHFVRDLEVLESDPYALDKGAEAAREESGGLVLCVLVDGVESWAGCLCVIPFARVSDCRHGGGRRASDGAALRDRSGTGIVVHANDEALTPSSVMRPATLQRVLYN